MLDKLEAIHARYQEIEQQMNDPQVTSDMKRYVKLSKDYKDLQPVVKAYHDYKALLDTIAECRELLATEKDEELREMAKAELAECNERREKMEDEIRILLIPEDPTDSKTPSSRSVAAPAATRPASSPATSSACTPASARRSIGK